MHGSRYTPASAQAALKELKTNDELRVALELNNPATRQALQLQSEDYHVLGWAPRYLLDDLEQAIEASPDAVKGRVVRINPPPAPANQPMISNSSPTESQSGNTVLLGFTSLSRWNTGLADRSCRTYTSRPPSAPLY